MSGTKNNNSSKSLSSSLSKILNKNVKVSKLGEGSYGRAYLLDIEGAKKYCLKVFKKNSDFSKPNTHGASIEPQIALYANKHYGEDFVKFYFGNLGHYGNNENQAFMVIEYLDENSRKKESEDKSGNYNCGDTLGEHNKINGIIFDFGAIHPLDKNKCLIESWSLYNAN